MFYKADELLKYASPGKGSTTPEYDTVMADLRSVIADIKINRIHAAQPKSVRVVFSFCLFLPG